MFPQFNPTQVHERNFPMIFWMLILKSHRWFNFLDQVYDVTKFLEDHPGGDEVLLSATGTTRVSKILLHTHKPAWPNLP